MAAQDSHAGKAGTARAGYPGADRDFDKFVLFVDEARAEIPQCCSGGETRADVVAVGPGSLNEGARNMRESSFNQNYEGELPEQHQQDLTVVGVLFQEFGKHFGRPAFGTGNANGNQLENISRWLRKSDDEDSEMKKDVYSVLADYFRHYWLTKTLHPADLKAYGLAIKQMKEMSDDIAKRPLPQTSDKVCIEVSKRCEFFRRFVMTGLPLEIIVMLMMRWPTHNLRMVSDVPCMN